MASLSKSRRTKRLKRTTRTKELKRHPFHPSAREGECRDKEKAMKQFAALLRKDNQPVRYLVVDDSVFARKNLIKMIEQFGGEVAGEAGDGFTAIAEFNRVKPDIVLVDITMPQMEGIEAVERIVRQHAEGRVILDLSPEVAIKVASQLAGVEIEESEQVVRETVCELANMVIGNSVTLLNDQGFHFKVFPPEIHMNDEGLGGSADTEALVICIETPCGQIYLNIAMRYLHRRRQERAVPALD